MPYAGLTVSIARMTSHQSEWRFRIRFCHGCIVAKPLLFFFFFFNPQSHLWLYLLNQCSPPAPPKPLFVLNEFERLTQAKECQEYFYVWVCRLVSSYFHLITWNWGYKMMQSLFLSFKTERHLTCHSAGCTLPLLVAALLSPGWFWLMLCF